MSLKFKVGDTVKIVRDNKVWNESVAKVVALSHNPEFPYVLDFISSNRLYTVGERFNWDEASLDLHDEARVRLGRIIEANFPNRLDVYYSALSGGAVVFGNTGKLYRLTASGDIESEAERQPYGRRK